MRTRAVLVVATGLAIALSPGVALAHAELEQATPPSGVEAPAPPAEVLQPVDDADVAATAYKGTWNTTLIPVGAYNKTIHWASTSASATIVSTSFTVSGNAAWVSTVGPNRGIAEVQVDGGSKQTIDLYAPTQEAARIVWARDALPTGTHTVTITVTNKRNTASTGTRVDVDMAAIIK